MMSARTRLFLGCIVACTSTLAIAFSLTAIHLPDFLKVRMSMVLGCMLGGFIARRRGWLCGLVAWVLLFAASMLFVGLYIYPDVASWSLHSGGFLRYLRPSLIAFLTYALLMVGGGSLGQWLASRKWSQGSSTRTRQPHGN
jgi:hypothetical protein